MGRGITKKNNNATFLSNGAKGEFLSIDCDLIRHGVAIPSEDVYKECFEIKVAKCLASSVNVQTHG
jgi:hypothetical protein